MKRILLLLLAAAACVSSAAAQVFAVTINAAGNGTGYTSVPTVVGSGGACSTEPTLQATLSGNTVNSVTVLYAGVCTPGGAAPAIVFSGGGGGSGAAATASMLSATIALLGSPLVTSDTNTQDSITGANKLYRYECTLIVPAVFVPFYSSVYNNNQVDRMPGTSQSSQLLWGVVQGAAALQALYNSAFGAGILTVYDGGINVNATTALATVETTAAQNCAQWQTALTAWNPWANYATYFNGSIWQTATIQ
jgi:hypothetical protein